MGEGDGDKASSWPLSELFIPRIDFRPSLTSTALLVPNGGSNSIQHKITSVKVCDCSLILYPLPLFWIRFVTATIENAECPVKAELKVS